MMWSSKFETFLASTLRTTSATTVLAAEIVEPSAQIGLVLSINDSNNIPSSSSSSTIVTTTPREGREASVESKRVGLGHFPAD